MHASLSHSFQLTNEMTIFMHLGRQLILASCFSEIGFF